MMSIKKHVPTVARFLPLQALHVRDKDVQGYYVAATGLSKDWRGCAVLHSLDGGQTWSQLTRILKPSVMGHVSEVWDDENGGGLIVRLLSPGHVIESFSDADIDAGKNRAVVNGEVISFKAADLVAAQTYSLTGLVRGRKGTLQASIKSGNEFTCLDLQQLARVDVLDNARTKGIYTVVSMGQKVIDEPAVSWFNLIDEAFYE